MRMLPDNTVMRVSCLFLMHQVLQLLTIKGTRVPFAWIIRLECSNIETSIDTGNCTIAKKGQRVRVGQFFICGQQSTGIANGQESSYHPPTRLCKDLSLA